MKEDDFAEEQGNTLVSLPNENSTHSLGDPRDPLSSNFFFFKLGIVDP